MILNKLAERSSAPMDVVGIGSALLDIIISVDEKLLADMGLSRGQMKLVDAEESKRILKVIGDMSREKAPGGSSANTLAGVAILGGTGLFIGKVGTDEYGDLYVMETRGAGIEPAIRKHDCITGHAITFITPDLERTFATHLGAALELGPSDIVEEDIARGKILHLEGYLFEPENLRAASLKAIEFAKKNNMLVSIDLSDPALIGRIDSVMHDIVERYADIVFANETEAQAFTGKPEKEALDILAGQVEYAVVKLGSRGSLIKTGGVVYEIPSFGVTTINTNGAGDMYAAGVLYGLCRGYDPLKAGTLGSFGASRVVAQNGARLTEKLAATGIV